MRVYDKMEKPDHQQVGKPLPSAEAVNAAIMATCSKLVLFVRDTNLPYEITHKYHKGMIVKERGFVDATALRGGMVTAHRYMILSNHMPMVPTPDKQWALCIANKDSRFLVLGKGKCDGKRVTVLLHLHNDSWQLFKSIDVSFSQGLLNKCFDDFVKCIAQPPIASVTSQEWLARCQFPVGMSDDGVFFSIDDEA